MAKQFLESYGATNKFGALCIDLPDLAFPVRLYQTKAKHFSFSVQYGMQVDHGLTYSKACEKLGQAIMHAVACNGDLDNDRD